MSEFITEQAFRNEEQLKRSIGPRLMANEDSFDTYDFNMDGFDRLYKYEDYFEQPGFIDEIGESVISEPYNKLTQEIEAFNQCYNWSFRDLHYKMTKERVPYEQAYQLEVYPKSLYWKKGTYDMILALVSYIQGMYTRPNFLESITDRIDRNRWGVDRLKNRFKRLDKFRREAKETGFSEADLETVKAKWDEFVSIPIKDAPDDTIEYQVFINEPQNTHYNPQHLELVYYIVMKEEHFKMECFAGQNRSKIATVPFTGDLEIIVKMPLLKRFSDYYHNRSYSRGTSSSRMRCDGRYDVQSMFRFPWINGEGNRSLNTFGSGRTIHEGFGNVCWGDISTDVLSAIYSLDKRSINMMLAVWCSQYSTVYSRPYNKFYMMHCGISNKNNQFTNDYCDLIGYNHQSLTQNVIDGRSRYTHIDQFLEYMEDDLVAKSSLGKDIINQLELVEYCPDIEYYFEQVMGNMPNCIKDQETRTVTGSDLYDLYMRRIISALTLTAKDDEGNYVKEWIVEWFVTRLESAGWYENAITTPKTTEQEKTEMAAWVAANSSRNISEESFREVVNEINSNNGLN